MSSIPFYNRKGKKKTVVEVEEVKESKPYLEEKFVSCCLREKPILAETVSLPTGVDQNEWLASHCKFPAISSNLPPSGRATF